MAHTHDDQTLSLLEQAVLARLPSKGSVRWGELLKDLAVSAAAGRPSDTAHAVLERVIDGLRSRELVADKTLRSTKAGERALREALGVRRAPTWPQFCRLLAARALGIPPASDLAKRTLDSRDALALAVLRQRTPLPPGTTLTAVGNALIAETLGMPPGKVTLPRARQHVLVRRIGVGAGAGPMAAAVSALQAHGTDRASLIEALALRVIDLDHTPHRRVEAPSHVAPGDHALLSLVQEALTHIGPDGRVGPEKVFVSVIWQQIAADSRASELSLDGFKQWLVVASREQLVALARADGVGAMDPRLVAESEIESHGATFHFVVDPRDDTQAERL